MNQDALVKLNENGLRRCQPLLDNPQRFRIAVECAEGGAHLIDMGIDTPGGLEAGRVLAEVCLADLATVQITPGNEQVWPGPAVAVATDHPIAACMASQYAGWPIGGEHFFAMGSGPMRAARGREPLFDEIGHRERPRRVIGVLESGRMPPAEICAHVAEDCGVEACDVTLLVAPTSSIAGSIQVVARTVETALHKLHELEFDITRVVSGFGVAPLPPVAANDLAGIGRTNDAVLYGGEVTLWVTGDDASLRQLGPRIPSSASADHGRPFGEIFEKYDRDFYKIDRLLFSPAVVTLVNIDSGHCFRFGETRPDVLQQSFSDST